MTADLVNMEMQAASPEPRAVIYVGEDPALIEAALAPLGTAVKLTCETKVANVLMAAAQSKAHAVIVNLTRPDDARLLLVAALAGARNPPRVIVLGRREDVGAHLRLPGVYCVVAYPLLPAQIRAAVADRRSKRRNNDVPKEPPASAAAIAPAAPPPNADFKAPAIAAAQARWPGWRLYFLGAGRFMTVVSNLYKNAAFVLLASLFGAFCFYGFLIAYFLLASGWGAPMTLTRGHQLVEKAVNDLSELRVTLSVNAQRRSEAALEAGKAKSTYDDAAVLVDFLKGTVDSEIAARLKQAAVVEKSAARMEKVLKSFNDQGGENAAQGQSTPQALYKKRLITRRTFDSQMLGSLEATQRLSSLENDLDTAKSEADRLRASVDLLLSLKTQLDHRISGKVTSGSASPTSRRAPWAAPSRAAST